MTNEETFLLELVAVRTEILGPGLRRYRHSFLAEGLATGIGVSVYFSDAHKPFCFY